MTPDLNVLSPLPDGWAAPNIFRDDTVVDGINVWRAGISTSSPKGEEITGAAAAADGCPIQRSYFELLERVSTIEALNERRSAYPLLARDGSAIGDCSGEELVPESDEPARWRYARSNGVALHASWGAACDRAFWELAERDRVLRAWYGEIRPERIDAPAGLANAQSYEWLAYLFPDVDVAFSRGVQVVGVYGFPRAEKVPLIAGYGARPMLDEARLAAGGEALQSLAFLWGEEFAETAAEPAPTPLYHLERWQRRDQHALLRAWLDGGHMQHRPIATRHVNAHAQLSFVDLTPPWLGGGLRVAKARCDDARPLAFGDAPFAAHLPPELRIHPIQ